MTTLELIQLRQRFVNSPLLRYIPETPHGNFEELVLHMLGHMDEMKAKAEQVEELYTRAFEQARELKDLLRVEVTFLRSEPKKEKLLARADEISQELQDYKEI